MNKLYSCIFLILIGCGHRSEPKSTEDSWSLIKQDSALLKNFIKELPKGGDIHHHLMGSVYAETYFHIAQDKAMWIDTTSFHLYSEPKQGVAVIPITQAIAAIPNLLDYAIDAWSIRNLDTSLKSGHDQFFSTFFKFQPAFAGSEVKALQEVCERAGNNNLSYVETSFLHWAVQDTLSYISRGLNSKEPVTLQQLNKWKDSLEKRGIKELSGISASFYDSLHRQVKDCGVTIAFQTYGNRCLPNQAVVFAQLLHGFLVAQQSASVVGVNFVAPEDFRIALSHFREHMAMFRFLNQQFPGVKVSLHAGELMPAFGDVTRDDLTFHIYESLITGKANRIGHGVDVRMEAERDSIIQWLKNNNICIELNLESNQVILNVDAENHPIHFYREQGVPFTISTDDEGVLRSDINRQYELLIRYLPDLTYRELKTIIFNSIRFSFLSDTKKKVVEDKLSHDFREFEKSMFH